MATTNTLCDDLMQKSCLFEDNPKITMEGSANRADTDIPAVPGCYNSNPQADADEAQQSP